MGQVCNITAISPAKAWVGLKNDADVGLKVDLQAEVLRNNMVIGSGQLSNQPTGSSGFNNALLETINLSLTGGPAAISSGDSLQIRLSVRRSCSSSGRSSGTVRLWYNGQPIDSGPSRDAGSRFDATIAGVTSNYFLRDNFSLSKSPGSSRLFLDASVDGTIACPARPFTPWGTWNITLP